MSWINRNTENQFTITTGDGKTFGDGTGASSNYRLLWKNFQKAVEFNTAVFNFPNLAGSLVKRSEPMGRTFTFELYFEGGGHLEASNEFEQSANDKRPWKVNHPYYGFINVQPLSITFDNSEFNITKFTIPVIETILDELPKSRVVIEDSIIANARKLEEELPNAILSPITAIDEAQLKATTNKSYSLSLPILKLPNELEDYYNAFNQASNFVNTATATPLLAIRAITQLISYPSKFSTSVNQRLDVLNTAFTDLRKSVKVGMSVAGKQIYQVNGAAYLLGMCVSASTPSLSDFTNKRSVLNINNTLLKNYNDYLNDLDFLQTLTGTNKNSFIPSASVLNQISQLVYLTISNLYLLALQSRTEKFIITQKNTNIILLTHSLYGLDNQDNNIKELIKNNGWGLNQLLQIEKGTRVLYYT